MSPRVLRLLLIFLLLALGLAACGGGDDASDKDVGQLLEDTFGSKKPVDSGKLNLALKVDAQSKGGSAPLDIALTGPFDSQGKGKLPKFAFTLRFKGGGQAIDAGAVSTGDKGFLSLGGTSYALSDQVFKQFKDGYEKAAGQDGKGSSPSLATLGIDPRKWLKNPRKVGEAKVGDTDTIKLTGDVDVPKLLDDVNRALAKTKDLGVQGAGQLPEQLTAAQKQDIQKAIKALSVDIYTGKKDTALRRLLVNLDLQVAAKDQKAVGLSSAKVTLDLQLTEVNEEQTIEAPKNPRPFEELQQGLSQLGLASGGGSSSGQSGGATQVPGVPQEYTQCLAAAGSDLGKAQECAKLLNK